MSEPRKFNHRSRVRTTFTGKSRAKQSMAAETNINNIMKKYRATGLLTHINEVAPKFGDFSDIPDYQTALNLVQQANEAFLELNSSIRKEFDNDPGKFLAFVEDPNNLDACIELGIFTKTASEDAGVAEGASEGPSTTTPSETPVAAPNASEGPPAA